MINATRIEAAAATAEVSEIPSSPNEIGRAIESAGDGRSSHVGRVHQDLGFYPLVVFPGSGKPKAPAYRVTVVVKGKFKNIGALWLQEDGTYAGTAQRADEEYENDSWIYEQFPEVTDDEAIVITGEYTDGLFRFYIGTRTISVTAQQLRW